MLYLQLILVIFFSIAIHELGHFIAAKRFGLNVEEFCVGIGPKLFSRKYHETKFSLKLIPVMGYVKTNEDEEERLRLNQKWVFILAGVFMNFLVYLFSTGMLGVVHGHGFYAGVVRGFGIISNIVPLILDFSQMYSPNGDINGQLQMYSDFALTSQNIWEVIGTINISMLVLNLVPIPVLDGGRVIVVSLESVLLRLGVKKESIKKVTNTLFIIGGILLFSPLLIDNIWSAGASLGLNLFESMLWFALLFSITMNVRIFIRNKKQKTQSNQERRSRN